MSGKFVFVRRKMNFFMERNRLSKIFISKIDVLMKFRIVTKNI